MKIYRKFGVIIIESETIVKFSGLLMVGKEGWVSAKAAAFFPFMFVRSKEFVTPIFVNHERIHFRQQLETLFIGSWLLQLVEDIYSRLVIKLSAPDYYWYRAVEQEAYRNQHNMDYLKNRKLFSLFRYVNDKKRITFVEDREPEVIVGEEF